MKITYDGSNDKEVVEFLENVLKVTMGSFKDDEFLVASWITESQNISENNVLKYIPIKEGETIELVKDTLIISYGDEYDIIDILNT